MTPPVSPEHREALAKFLASRCRRDVNVFTQFVQTDETGKPLKQGAIHRDMQKFLDENDRGVLMWPREHGKTTQMIARIAWEIGRNKNIRIKIVAVRETNAAERGQAIRRLLESSRYRLVFPTVQRGRFWTDSGLTVERTSHVPDPTLGCYGLDSGVTGGRADLIFFDDPEDVEVVDSVAVRKKNLMLMRERWLPLLAPNGRAYQLCTPWHSDDIAGNMKKVWPIKRIAIKNMTPVWPERWSVEALEKKKREIGSVAFARGFELEMIAEADAVIRSEWFRYWDVLPLLTEIAIPVDLAISETKGSDYTAIGVMGASDDDKARLIEVVRERMTFPATLKKILDVVDSCKERWPDAPITVGVEAVAYQRAVAQALREYSWQRQFDVVELTAAKNKRWRAEALGAEIEKGRVLLRGENGVVDDTQKIVYGECVSFPTNEHDDCLDMLGYGAEMLLTKNYSLPSVF